MCKKRSSNSSQLRLKAGYWHRTAEHRGETWRAHRVEFKHAPPGPDTRATALKFSARTVGQQLCPPPALVSSSMRERALPGGWAEMVGGDGWWSVGRRRGAKQMRSANQPLLGPNLKISAVLSGAHEVKTDGSRQTSPHTSKPQTESAASPVA